MASIRPDQSFLSVCHRHRVAEISMLYKVNSNSNHCLFCELPSASTIQFNILELRPQLVHWILKYHGVERPKLLVLSCRLRFDCGMTFPTLCLIPERWMGSRVQPPLVASLSCVFFNFPWRICLLLCESNL